MCRPVDNFACPVCGKSYTAATYATRRSDDAKICDPCAQASELHEAETAPRIYAYLSGDGTKITGWTGNALATVTRLRNHRTGFGGSWQSYIRATTPGGRILHGRGAGTGICCTLRPSKVK